MVAENAAFTAALDRMRRVHAKKSHDYADTQTGNFYSNFEVAGVVADKFTAPTDKVFASLIGVKLGRLQQLLGEEKAPQHESIADTFLDLANYAVLWWTYWEAARVAGREAPATGPAEYGHGV